MAEMAKEVCRCCPVRRSASTTPSTAVKSSGSGEGAGARRAGCVGRGARRRRRPVSEVNGGLLWRALMPIGRVTKCDTLKVCLLNWLQLANLRVPERV